MADLTPIPDRTLADEVEIRLRAYIRESGLGPGDALPAELELAERLGVSRNILREALSRLRMLGMVRSRKRRGMVLAAPDVVGALERVMDVALLDEARARELRELRIVLEIGLADLLMARLTPEDLDELEAIVAEEEAVARSRKKSNACDIRFHAKLYEIAGNEVLARFQGLLAPFFAGMRGKGFQADRFDDRDAITHRTLLAALRRGDADAFRQTMADHLRIHLDALLESALSEPRTGR